MKIFVVVVDEYTHPKQEQELKISDELTVKITTPTTVNYRNIAGVCAKEEDVKNVIEATKQYYRKKGFKTTDESLYNFTKDFIGFAVYPMELIGGEA